MRKTFLFVNTAACFFLIAATIFVGRDVFSRGRSNNGYLSQKIERQGSAEKKIINRKKIGRTNIFCNKNISGTDQKSELNNRVSYKLIGTAFIPEGHSYAILEKNDGGKQMLVSETDKIDDLVIKLIKENTIVLVDIDGKETRLFSEGDKREKQSKEIIPGEVAIKYPAKNRYILAREDVRRSLANLGNIFTKFRAVPHKEEGVVKGFRIIDVVPDSIVKRIGLQSGDLILSVNGRSVCDLQGLSGIYEDVQKETSIELNIVRGTGEMTLTYELSDS
ncbi:MAG: PDZ domain-containing protein [Candidatus Theseobacter exili]|nr:PDZ domain-containing protein [Candidatus Theseobacter exili]